MQAITAAPQPNHCCSLNEDKMRTIIGCCVGRPVSIAMALCALLLLGVKASLSLPVRAYPDVSVPRVMVGLSMPGLPASDISALVVSPLEDALAAAKGLVRTASIARDGQALITLDFSWGDSPARASARVREILDAAYPSLPEGLVRPSVLSYNPDDVPLVVIGLVSRHGDPSFARRMAEYELSARLRRLEGAGAVQLVGGRDRELVVAVDADRAAARGMSIADVAMAIACENTDMPAGSLREGDRELVAIVKGRATSIEELATMKAMGPHGIFRLSDLATVRERDADRKSLFVSRGEECVALEVYLRPGADPLACARRVRAAALGMSRDFNDTLLVDIVSDGSMVVAESLKSLAYAGAIAALAVALVLFAVLRDMAAGILVALTIPLSVAASLATLSVFGRSLNGMSLGGMSLAIGMISDHAVLVTDSLSLRFSGKTRRPSCDAIASAVETVVAGTFGSMVTTAVVFIPVFFMPGALGSLFGDMALALISTSVAGWIIAILALPSAYRVFWRKTATHDCRMLRRLYRKALSAAMRKPAVFLLGASLATLAGFAIVVTRPLSFLPPEAARELRLMVEFLPGSNLDAIADSARPLCKALSALPGIGSVYSWAGAEDNDISRRSASGFTNESLCITCSLDGTATEHELGAAIQSTAASLLPGSVTFLLEAPVDRTASILGLDGNFSIAVRGADPVELRLLASRVEATLKSEALGTLASLSRTPGGTKPRLSLRPYREVQAAMGISLVDTARVVQAASEGVELSSMAIDGREIGIRVLAAAFERDEEPDMLARSDGLARIEAVPLQTSSGLHVPAAALVQFRRTYDEASVARLDRACVIYLEPRAVPGKEDELGLAISRTLKMHPEAVMSHGSAFNEYGMAMFYSLALVIVLLYLTLGSQFESFVLPILIMATIPLAMAGVGPALALTGIGLDSGSILGLIVLFGVVVNNAIFLHEATVAHSTQGLRRVVAAYAGASERVRPILATTLTTVVALFPICLSRIGSTQRSMAVAMIGGLIASTALTLLISPLALARCSRLPDRKEP